jgi:hypothetical protein
VQEVHATVLVSVGLATALQIISNMSNQGPSFSHMSRANSIISLYQRYNTRLMKAVPPIDITSNSLSNLRTIQVLANISNVFSHDGGFPSDRHSINFQLQVC